MEDLLWLVLAAGLFQTIPFCWESLMLLSSSFIFLFLNPQNFLLFPMRRKQRLEANKTGLQMSIVMIPALLQAMAYHHGTSNSAWAIYGKIATLLAIPEKSMSLALSAIVLVLDPVLDTSISCCFIAVWHLLLPMVVSKNFTKSFTSGELRVVSLSLIVIIAEFAKATIVLSNENYKPHYSLVALSGSVSCFVFAYLGNHIQMLSWWWKLLVNLAGPLLAVDLSLHKANNFTSSSRILPLSIQWLFEFLTEKENGYERFWGLMYWVAVLSIGIYPTFVILSLPSDNKPSVAVTRKWFHLLAVLLFGPITWQFPQLMSLSYAIAACILVVLETLRNDAPSLQSFYTAFIDDRKDDGGHIIVSHIFLIIGCAAPLWVSQVLWNRISSPSSSSLLLAEFGVLCIGIGDAMGAVIGKSMGQHKWGENQRTLEGSLAMWFSMVVIGMFSCVSVRECVALVVSATFTTILEAFTVQLDNLVLPVFGSSIILLILKPSL